LEVAGRRRQFSFGGVWVEGSLRQGFLPIVIVALIFLSSIFYSVAAQGSARGIYVRFFDELGRSLSGIDVYVQVWVIDPNAVPSAVNVYYGKLIGSELFISAENSVFRRVLESWNGLYPKDIKYETCLGIFLWIIMDGQILSYPLIAVNYNPLLASKSVIYREIAVNVYSATPKGIMPEWIREAETMKIVEPAAAPPAYMYIRDNQLSWESGNYIKVPILIVHNDYAYSGVIGSYIDIKIDFEVGSRITIGYGVNIRSKLLNAEMPTPIKFTIGSPSIKGRYYFGKDLIVPPNAKRYVWINAKVAHIHYREAFAYPDTGEVIYYTGNEMVLEYLYQFQINGNIIVGGMEDGSPSCENLVFNGTVEENLIISGTALSDGDLDVNEFIHFSQIFPCYDIYNVDSEIGMPIGALVALLSSAFGFTGPVATAITSFLSGIAASLSYVQSIEARVSGTITNYGQEGNLGYDVYEIIYCRRSKYLYQAPNNQYFKVPISIYFRCA